jgi:pimeloyl-ACP methyl ester carboxylesterase
MIHVLLAAACLSFASEVMAAEETDGARRPNMASPTLGGMQFWTDEVVHQGWRVQRHVWTNHYRLLDARDVRRGWGSFAHCKRKLAEQKESLPLAPLQPRVVLMLHGLGRSRKSMDSLSRHLRDRGELTVLEVGYASTRESIEQHARSLAKVVEHLEGVRDIDFVAHSLGNLVIRRYLASIDPQRPPAPRVRRIVMLGPPNNGAQLAERFRGNPLFAVVMGRSGTQLAERWETLAPQLATPQCEFGILAGGTQREMGRNPLLRGDDDLVVSVAETRLAGASDFLVVPAVHTVMMDDKLVQECTLRFLQTGYFLSEERRCPISVD